MSDVPPRERELLAQEPPEEATPPANAAPEAAPEPGDEAIAAEAKTSEVAAPSPFGDMDERIQAFRRQAARLEATEVASAEGGLDEAPLDTGAGEAGTRPLKDDWAPAQREADAWSPRVPTSLSTFGAPDETFRAPGTPVADLDRDAWGPPPGHVGDAAVLTAPAPPRTAGRGAVRFIREIAETVILALLIFLVVRAVVQNFQVEGSSMEPTLESSWYLLVNKAAYWEINLKTLSKFVPFLDPGDDPTRYVFGGPDRGDVVVFISPDQSVGETERDFIKRIIGLPGETVEVKDCTVYINGKPLDEPYILEKPNYPYGPETVPPDHYFVLGDNRNNSRDSHVFGPVAKEALIGKAWLTYWPFDVFGLVDNTSVEPGSGEGLPKDDPIGACAAA